MVNLELKQICVLGRFNWLSWWACLACTFIFLGCGRPRDAGVSTAALSADAVFSNSILLRIEIEIPRAGVRILRGTQWVGESGERPETRATVKEGGTVYKDVAVHLKGAAGSFRSIDGHPALTLNFDKFAPGQSFHGLHKISLNNSVQDYSFLSEKICRELFEAAGVPVPRAGHALVRLNGRELGLYVMLEGANKQFLKRHFRNAQGNLYDGGFVRDIQDPLTANSGAHPEDNSGLQALISALHRSTDANAFARIEQVLDVDRFISMMAMEVLTCHWDGYSLNKNNWRIFHDLDSNKMVFIPHGLDQTFRDDGRIPRQFQHSFQWQGRVAAALMGTPEGRRRLQTRLRELSSSLDPGQISARIDAIEAVLVPAVAQWNPRVARDQEQGARDFKGLVERRIEQLRRQLAAAEKPVQFGSDGTVALRRWERAPQRRGGPTLRQIGEPGGQRVLSIAAGPGASVGSWRTRVLLGEGRYRFEGKVQVQDVSGPADPAESGAALRISRGTPRMRLSGTTEWQELAYEFQQNEVTEVELVCELKASAGEARFDAASLRLVRLP